MSLADRLNAARNRRPAPGLPDLPPPAPPTDAESAPPGSAAPIAADPVAPESAPDAPVDAVVPGPVHADPVAADPSPSDLVEARPDPVAVEPPAGHGQATVPDSGVDEPFRPRASWMPAPAPAEIPTADGAAPSAPAIPTGPPAEPAPSQPASPPPAPAEPSTALPPPAPAEPATADEPEEVARLRAEASELLAERLGSRFNDRALSEDDLLAAARRELASIIDERGAWLPERDRLRLIKEIADDALGLGPLQELLDDPTVTEIMVNGPSAVYVERGGRIQRSHVTFRSEARLRRVIERIVSRVGRRIDESSPLVDARLPDGSRVNAIIPPLVVGGSSLTIRKFAVEPFQAGDLVSLGTITRELAELLVACVQARLNVVISGGTGTGKTTLLNVLSSYIPSDERIVTIEDAVELQLQQEHVVRLESRPANIEGRGEVTIRDLVRNALRMRPDRIVVGECRGGEALDMLQAMNTGHDGSLSTVHANSPRDTVSRLETLTLMAGMDLPLRAVREQIASAVDVIIHIARLRDGTRRVTHVTEVIGMEHDVVTLQDVFLFDFRAGVDSSGRFTGTIRPTGVRPRFTERFAELGIPFDPMVFAGELR